MAKETPRQQELQDVYRSIQEDVAAAFYLGRGHGATFYAESAEAVTRKPIVHSVHFTPAAMHLRYGLIGWLFYLGAILALLRMREPINQSFASEVDLLALKGYALCAAICSLLMFGFIDDMLIGVALGIYYCAYRSQQASYARQRSLNANRVSKEC